MADTAWPDPQGKAGLAARRAALLLWQAVHGQHRQLDQALGDQTITKGLQPRDLAFAHAVAAAALRHHGEITEILKGLLRSPLPRSSGPAKDILHLGLGQLLFMGASAPAAINLSVELAKEDAKAKHFAALINGVLREAQRQQGGTQRNPRLNLPAWLAQRLDAAYGAAATDAIAAAHGTEAAIDISVRSGAATWAEQLKGQLLPTGTIRLADQAGSVTDLPGYAEGAWWVQDAAAALPVKLLGADLAGKTALDLCAAPGGKTAQLASRCAQVTAVDISSQRMMRLQQNMDRLQLPVTCLTIDMRQLPDAPQYDIVVLDAPCSATGTMRRHPDLAHLKSSAQIDKLTAVQSSLLARAAQLVKPGGTLLYCVCSLLPEEGENQAKWFLQLHPGFSLVPATVEDVGGQAHFLTTEGMVRTLPQMQIGDSPGLDGFLAARFVRH